MTSPALPATPPAPAGASSVSFAARHTPTGRLGQGELRRQVAAHLAATPGDHTPGEIARALGDRSSGAVANALETLEASGHAEQISTKPRRFRRTATTTDAARGATPPRPQATGSAPTSAAPVSTAPGGGAATGPHGSAPSGGATSGTSGPGTGGSGTVMRPNGQTYHPRVLADLPDVDALRRLRKAGVPAMLYGPPGTGKTSLVEAAFEDLVTVAGDGDTAVADFIGEYTQTSAGTYEFIYGPLVTAMAEGRCLFIDDATLISPKVLAVVYPAMDGRRQITVKAHTGETVTAADGFYVIAGHNPGVHGAVLTEALASRFAAQIKVSTDYDLARTLRIDPRAIKVARNLAARAEAGVIGWAPYVERPVMPLVLPEREFVKAEAAAEGGIMVDRSRLVSY